MPARAERNNTAHTVLGRTEDRRTYRRPHRTGRKIAVHEGSLPRIPQATPGRKEDDNDDATPGNKEDDNDDATPGMKKDDNHDATPGMKEDKHDE